MRLLNHKMTELIRISMLQPVVNEKQYQVTPDGLVLKQFQRDYISFNRVAMASKGTPKKVNKKRKETTSISRCRLCNCICDPGHNKNLFREQSRTILRNAEIICGGELPQNENLPHLICKPCERKLNNSILFRECIRKTQQALSEDVRTKRCVEISPSVIKLSSKVRAVSSSRRVIDFTVASSEPQSQSVGQVSVHTHF